MLLNIFTSLHRSNLKEYIKRANVWTMKRMDKRALKAEKIDGNRKVG